MANVYVFNLSVESTQLFVNGAPVGNISGLRGGGSTPYIPVSVAVPRVANMSQAAGKFCNGSNQLRLDRDIGLSHFGLEINGREIPITQDLLLYIAVNQWFLVNSFGTAVGSGSIDNNR